MGLHETQTLVAGTSDKGLSLMSIGGVCTEQDPSEAPHFMNVQHLEMEG